MRSARLTAAILGTIGALAPGGPRAAEDDETVPKWEIGIAGGAGMTPHYPASDQRGHAVAAAPFLIYRWERVRIGEDGFVGGRVARDRRYELTVSIAGSLPADSDRNRARAGMPDLDALVEIGPQLELTLTERRDIDSVKLKLPVRAVLSVDLWDAEYRGILVNPRISYTRDRFLLDQLEASVSLGPVFASSLLMDYFYTVQPQFATPVRPEYQASGGYLGADFGVGLTYEFSERFRVFVGGKIGYYDGATNADSPLFRTHASYTVGTGFVWKILLSKEQVPD